MIDAHCHLWQLADVGEEYWLAGREYDAIRRDIGFADLEEAAAATGVDGFVVVQAVARVAETSALLALAAETPAIRGVVGWVDLTNAELPARLADLRSGPGGDKLVGLRHLLPGDSDPAWIARPDVAGALSAVAEAGLAFDLLVTERELPYAVAAADGFDDRLRLVLDHCANPPLSDGDLRQWEGHVRALATLPNLACKVSGLTTRASWSHWTIDDLAPAVEVVVDAFGPDRLMFGSDWPVSSLASSYSLVVETAAALLAGLDHDRVFAGTAAEWYGLA